MIRIEKLKFTVFSVSVLFVFAVFLGAVIIALEDKEVRFIDALIVGAVMTAVIVFLIEIGGRVYRRVFKRSRIKISKLLKGLSSMEK